jgi:hypothetical protein
VGFLFNDEKRRIKQAQAFMRRGQYEQARQLLQGIDRYEAIELTAQMNERYFRSSRAEASPREKTIYYPATPSGNKTRELSGVERIAIVVILICMMLWTIVLLVTAYLVGGSGTMLIATGLSLAYWLGLWISYYVLWRWFWVVTAIGWVIGSLYACGTMILIGDLSQILIPLIPRI